jgi:hypothetical protein
MSNFKKLLSDFVSNTEQREQRIARNQEIFELNVTEAMILEESMVRCVFDVAAVLGKSIDDMGERLQGPALVLLAEVVPANLIALQRLIHEVAMLTEMRGAVLDAPNPKNPTCDCNSCKAVRALSQAIAVSPMLAGDRE